MVLIVGIGAPITVLAENEPEQRRDYPGVVGGLQASAALIPHGGRTEGIAVELTPLGSRALLGLPARALFDTSLDLIDALGPAGGELWERLQGEPSWDERFRTVDMILLRVLRDDLLEPALRRSWQLLVSSPSRVGVIAEAIGWSRQHFARRFADEFGPSPKLAARIVRLERARGLLEGLPIAEAATRAGYYDQAHMNRDFVDLAGVTPARLRADDLPSVQDNVGDNDENRGHERTQPRQRGLAQPHVS
jgi:AraC-like DNA-binding protein